MYFLNSNTYKSQQEEGMDERSTDTAYTASPLERAPRAHTGWAAYCPPSLWALGGLNSDLLNLPAPTTGTAEVLSRHGS